MNRRFAMSRFLLPVLLIFVGCATTPESTAEESVGLSFIHLNDTYRVGAVEDGKRRIVELQTRVAELPEVAVAS